MAIESTNQLGPSLTTDELNDHESIEVIVSRVADLLDTPIASLVSALAATQGKKEVNVEEEEEEDDNEGMSESREFEDCRGICQSIWPDVHLQMVSLASAIGTRWRTAGVLKVRERELQIICTI